MFTSDKIYLGCLLLSFDLIHQPLYTVFDIKLTFSGALAIFRLTEV